MATLILALGSCVARMTPGERRTAEQCEQKLDADYLLWYDVAVQRKLPHQLRRNSSSVLDPGHDAPRQQRVPGGGAGRRRAHARRGRRRARGWAVRANSVLIGMSALSLPCLLPQSHEVRALLHPLQTLQWCQLRKCLQALVADRVGAQVTRVLWRVRLIGRGVGRHGF